MCLYYILVYLTNSKDEFVYAYILRSISTSEKLYHWFCARNKQMIDAFVIYVLQTGVGLNIFTRFFRWIYNYTKKHEYYM
jgi:hypothetical protein